MLGVWFFSISCFLVMSEELASCINPQSGGQVIFGQGSFL